MTAATNSTTHFSISHSSKSLFAKRGKHGTCCSLNVNGCGSRINGGGGPDMAAVRICQTRTLPAVAAPESALWELKLAVAALNEDPPCFESGIIRVQVPIQQQADAIDWLHSQQNISCCYFSGRGQKHDFRLFEDKECSNSSLKAQKLISTAGVGSAVFFQRFDKFALQDWRCIKRFLSSDSPLIRAYGGIRFDSKAPISSEWKDFGSFYFIIPQSSMNWKKVQCLLLLLHGIQRFFVHGKMQWMHFKRRYMRYLHILQNQGRHFLEQASLAVVISL